MNLANIGYTDASNTRIQIGNYQVPHTQTTFPGFSNTYGVDNRCPFFRIFAGFAGGDASGNPVNAFATTFEFKNGGTTVSRQTIVWGVDTIYNNSTAGTDVISGLTMTPFMGNDSYIIHSQYAQLCAVVAGNLNDDGKGFICRWTALADQVVLTTTLIGTQAAFVQPGFASEYYHGYLQQPWTS